MTAAAGGSRSTARRGDDWRIPVFPVSRTPKPAADDEPTRSFCSIGGGRAAHGPTRKSPAPGPASALETRCNSTGGRRAPFARALRRAVKREVAALVWALAAEAKRVRRGPHDGADDVVIKRAPSNHPYLARDGEPAAHVYDDRHGVGEVFGGALPAPVGDVYEVAFHQGELRALREHVAAWSTAWGLGPEHAAELVLAVNELATNSIRYGGGGGVLRMWRQGGQLLCEVDDAGQILDPLAGRVRPEFDRPSGRGLWIVNQVCDFVQIRSSCTGTRVRLRMLVDG